MEVVSKIILFTLAACPMGRNMGTVLKEVSREKPSIKMETVYVEIDIETTNHYKVKTNPTLLFLDSEDKELNRLEGFHETTEINHMIREINENRRIPNKIFEPNKGTIEDYTIFLLKDGKPTAVKVQYQNKTPIKAPRITVISILLDADMKGFENPFPTDSKLHSIEFDQSLAKITIKIETHSNTTAIKQMEMLLLNTLEIFGIEKVSLSII